MTEAVSSDLPTTPAGAALGGAQSAGQMLRQLREQAGVDRETLASFLKIPVGKLDALESDQLSQLPGIFFARGLAANVCRYFHVDPQAVLSRMPDEKPHIHTDDESINTPFSAARGNGAFRDGPAFPGWVYFVIGLLLLAALLLFLLPSLNAHWGGRLAGIWETRHASAPANAAASGLTTPGAGPTAVATAAAASGPAMPMTNLQPATAATPTNIGAAPVAAPVSSAAAATPAPAASAPTAQPEAASANQALVFSASGDSWVQVRNAAGKTLYERGLKSGEQQSVPVNDFPVRVTIGRAENVQLQVRGQPFNLPARSGVARFEVK